MSAINRALWAAGLKALVSADRAAIILKKDAPYSHKLAASDLKVSVHSEDAFVRYARSLSPNFDRDITYLDSMNVWDTLIDARRNNPALRDLLWYVTTQSALEQKRSKGNSKCIVRAEEMWARARSTIPNKTR